MKIYSYIVRYDTGFAPNPFERFCTLATCKPRIRKKAEKGDWIVGTGSVDNIGNDKLVYAMEISEILSFDEYWRDDRFQYKKPNLKSKDPILKLGDNIYWKDKRDIFHQEPSKHSNKDGTENEKTKEHDLNGLYVLISDNFYYYGKKGIKIPEKHSYIIKNGQGHKCNFTKEQVNLFFKWLKALNYGTGRIDDPYLMEKDIDICHKCIENDGTPEDEEE